MIKLKREGLNIRYYGDSPSEINKLEAGLKFYVSGAEYAPSFKKGQWDGYYRFFESKIRTFKYGVLHIVIEQLKKYKIQYVIENEFKRLKVKGDLKIDPNLWDHQKQGIIRFLTNPYGTIKIPTRGGKTKMAAEIIRLVDFETVLFIVDSQLLFDQAIKDISEHLKLNRKQIGQIKGEIFDLKPITVAMIQTLQSIRYGAKRLRNKNEKKPMSLPLLKQQRKEKRVRTHTLQQYLETVQLLVVDEIHMYISDERINVCRECTNAQGVLCLSATPEKSSSIIDNIKIKSLGGPIIYEVLATLLKERGVLAQEKIILIMIDHNKNKNIAFADKDDFDIYEERLIVKNEQRNNILINVLQILRHLNLKTLVLFQYVLHGKSIQQILGDELLTGETKLDQRKRSITQFLKRKGGILLATGIFNKGLTLPEVQVMVNAGAGKEQSMIIQKKGRTLGTTKEKKKAITIDLIDISDYFSQHSLSRVQVYEEQVGLENIEIFDSLDGEFYSDLRESLTNWKNNE
jgi:superfamily II DNA or RNA helicase